MITTEYGPPIQITDGKKPDWLDDDQVCAICEDGFWLSAKTARNWFWDKGVTAIRLLADDPYYKRGEVTLEALEAAAKMAGHKASTNTAESVLKNPQKHPAAITELARMIMKHEPELIAESFDQRTEREFNEFVETGCGSLEKYRAIVRKHLEDKP